MNAITATHGIRLHDTISTLADQLAAYAGADADNFDIAAAAADYAAALIALAVERGWTWWGVYFNLVSVPLGVTRADVLSELEEIDVAGILQRHDRTAVRA